MASVSEIVAELKSTETECLENRIHLDWHSTTTLQGRRRSPDGLWAIGHANVEGVESRCLHRTGADNGGSCEQYCTWLHVPTSPTLHLLLVALTTATVSYTVFRKKKFSDFKWSLTLRQDSLLVRESLA